jgi:AcrR family transcriptional regulator
MVKKADIPDHVVDTALALAAEKGWRRLSLADIAVAAKLPIGAVLGAYRSKAEILAAFARRIDQQVAEGTSLEDLDRPARERLFDVLMRRFDALGPHRQGVRAIVRDLPRDPLAGACAGATLLCSMVAMLEAAGIRADGIGGLLRAKGLAAIYLATMRVWLDDDTEDLGRTMAALHRRLEWADRVIAGLCGRRGKAKEQASAGT